MKKAAPGAEEENIIKDGGQIEVQSGTFTWYPPSSDESPECSPWFSYNEQSAALEMWDDPVLQWASPLSVSLFLDLFYILLFFNMLIQNLTTFTIETHTDFVLHDVFMFLFFCCAPFTQPCCGVYSVRTTFQCSKIRFLFFVLNLDRLSRVLGQMWHFIILPNPWQLQKALGVKSSLWPSFSFRAWLSEFVPGLPSFTVLNMRL